VADTFDNERPLPTPGVASVISASQLGQAIKAQMIEIPKEEPLSHGSAPTKRNSLVSPGKGKRTNPKQTEVKWASGEKTDPTAPLAYHNGPGHYEKLAVEGRHRQISSEALRKKGQTAAEQNASGKINPWSTEGRERRAG